MRVESPNMGWHGTKDRILSIDFHPFEAEFASAGSQELKLRDEESFGTDGCIKIWQIVNNGLPLSEENGNIRILYGLPDAVVNTNVVRFSPNGQLLASGDDSKCITLWAKRLNTLSISRPERIVRWSAKDSLLGHINEVLDLRWTNDSRYLVSGGMDRKIYVWNIEKRYHVKVLDQHEKFVQGIAVDPTFEHILSCSNDRTTKLWKAVQTKHSVTEFYCKKTLKRQQIIREEDQEPKQGFRIFADQSVPTFFRRLDFSPDGELFVVPAGIWQRTPESPPQYCAFLYRKQFLQKPSFVLPTKGEPALVCRFNKELYSKVDVKEGLFRQDYYMVFAVGTTSTLLVYNTLSTAPLYAMGNYHYAALTDLAWRASEFLAVSSSDGFCSFMIFEPATLGTPYTPDPQLAAKMYPKQKEKKESKETKEVKEKELEQRVEYRETETGVRKKIIPKQIGDM